MKIIIDSNIVFSAILNTKTKIGQLILNGSKHYEFYTINQLKDEILKHKEKILSISGYSEAQFQAIFQMITGRIQFLDELLISEKDITKALELVADIDENDTLFVAITNRLKARLWTGDKRLINGLRQKGYKQIITTDNLFEEFLIKQLRTKRNRNRK